MGLLEVGGCKLNSVIHEVWLVESHRLPYKVISIETGARGFSAATFYSATFNIASQFTHLQARRPSYPCWVYLHIMPASPGMAGKPEKGTMSSRLLTMKVCIITIQLMEDS
jgi:hypothetical protein